MKKILFITTAILCYTTIFSQVRVRPHLMVKKWHADLVKSNVGNPSGEDLAKQIVFLEIKEPIKQRKNRTSTVAGSVEYGTGGNNKTSACSIITKGDDITIKTEEQSWSGKILPGNGSNNQLTMQLGSLNYIFGSVLVPVGPPSATSSFKPEDFYGYWQEISRTKTGNNMVNIGTDDTLYLHFSSDSSMWRPGKGFAVNFGRFNIKGMDLNLVNFDDLQMSATYHVVSLSAQNMVLKDDDPDQVSFTLVKTAHPFSWDAKTVRPIVPLIYSPDSLMKTWFAYNIGRPQGTVQQDNDIQTLTISTKYANNSYAGSVSFGKRMTNNIKTEVCTLTFAGNSLKIKADSHTWNGQLFKADPDSIIFGDAATIKYYFGVQQIDNTPTGTDTINLTPEVLLKNWHVYKPDAIPGFVKPETMVISDLNIIKSLEIRTNYYKYSGTVTFHQGIGGTNIPAECIIEFTTDQSNGGSAWIKITSLDGKYAWPKTELFNTWYQSFCGSHIC